MTDLIILLSKKSIFLGSELDGRVRLDGPHWISNLNSYNNLNFWCEYGGSPIINNTTILFKYSNSPFPDISMHLKLQFKCSNALIKITN